MKGGEEMKREKVEKKKMESDGERGIREMGFKVKPKEKKDSINTAGYISVILQTPSSSPCPSPIQPL